MLAPWQAANPSIDLVRHVVAPSDLAGAEMALAKSGGPADVAYTDWGAMLGDAGVVDPLDVGPLARTIVAVAFAPHSSGNQVYALPVFLSCLGLYLGHARFQDAELDPKAPLRSWSAFETAAQKLTDRARRRYGSDVFGSGTPRSGQMRYGPFLWSAGGSFFDDAGAKATWNDPPGLDAIIFLARLSQNYATPGSATAADETLLGNWLAGRTALLLAGPEVVPRIDARGLAYSVQSVPAYIQGQASSIAMSAGASALFAISKHKDWALDFVRYLADKDAQVAGLTTAPLLPANSDAGDDAPVFQGNPVLAEFLRILREDDVHAFPLARSHNSEIQAIFRAYLGVALQGLITPELAWSKSTAEATTLLAASATPTPGA
jgi:ABC-type glycerol-3-phosphate transport system substrate-binding protein